ncbi:MAG TPA: hypothetical protein VIK48_00870, partial [Candidatus Manganitrophaceae bacterium]
MEIITNRVFFPMIVIMTNSFAQILLKMGSGFIPLSAKWSLFLFLSLSFYFVSFFGYFLILKFIDISKIAPIMMVGTISVIAIYGFWMGESFNVKKLIGIVLA